MSVNLGEVKLYEIGDIAKSFNISKSTIRGYFRSGKLKGQKFGGRWFIPEEALREYLKIKQDAVDKKQE